jgi:hypothetical protein
LLSGHLGQRDLLAGFLDVLTRNRHVFEIFATDHASLVAAEIAERSVELRRELVRQLAAPDPAPSDLIRASAALGAVTQGFTHAKRLDPGVEAPGADIEYPDGDELTELLIGLGLRVLRRSE